MSESTAPSNAFIAVGANIDPEQNIPRALDILAREVQIVGISTFYITPALGRPEQSDYRNGVVDINTAHPPRDLKQNILRPIEAKLGRVRQNDKYAARPIDLDILLHGEHVLHTGEIQLPDPDLYTRIFLAAPLLELRPTLVLPGKCGPLAALPILQQPNAMKSAKALTTLLKERYLP